MARTSSTTQARQLVARSIFGFRPWQTFLLGTGWQDINSHWPWSSSSSSWMGDLDSFWRWYQTPPWCWNQHLTWTLGWSARRTSSRWRYGHCWWGDFQLQTHPRACQPIARALRWATTTTRAEPSTRPICRWTFWHTPGSTAPGLGYDPRVACSTFSSATTRASRSPITTWWRSTTTTTYTPIATATANQHLHWPAHHQRESWFTHIHQVWRKIRFWVSSTNTKKSTQIKNSKQSTSCRRDLTGKTKTSRSSTTFSTKPTAWNWSRTNSNCRRIAYTPNEETSRCHAHQPLSVRQQRHRADAALLGWWMQLRFPTSTCRQLLPGLPCERPQNRWDERHVQSKSAWPRFLWRWARAVKPARNVSPRVEAVGPGDPLARNCRIRSRHFPEVCRQCCKWICWLVSMGRHPTAEQSRRTTGDVRPQTSTSGDEITCSLPRQKPRSSTTEAKDPSGHHWMLRSRPATAEPR